MSELFEKAKRAVDLMVNNAINPSPANYEFWFRYVSGFDADLVAEVDAVLASQGKVSARAMEDLRNRFLGKSYAESVDTLVGKTAVQIDRLHASVSTAGGDATAYRTTLETTSGGLRSNSNPEDQRRLIENIVNATSSMIDRTSRLEKQLEASSEEIAALRRDLDRARSESRTDPLTGLANRKALEAYLEAHAARALADRKPLSVIFSDIDHFKKFNDSFGHRMGDEVLRLVGHSMEHMCKGLGFPARYGGEEFVIVLPGKDIDAATDIAEQIRDFIGTRAVRAKHSNQTIGRVTLSLGIAQLKWEDSIETLVERADAALYLAKDLGRNRTCTQADLAAHKAQAARAVA
jgi:diguanylate cyclase